MDVKIEKVHIGKAIEELRKKKDISKSELGRRIGVPQQHVNRILERETIDTNRLVMVSEALDFNFFTLFCPSQHQIYANNSSIFYGNGNLNNRVGDAGLAAELKSAQDEIANLKGNINLLNDMIKKLEDQVAHLESNLKDKDTIIQLTNEIIELSKENRLQIG